MSFKKNKYQVIKNAISTELADFCYQYFLNKRAVARHLFDDKYISQFTDYFGVWNDQQIPETYSHYGDIVMDTLLQKVKPIMEKESGVKLTETYSYARIYKKGDELKRHKDRYSCEISTTMNLGGDDWSIFLEPSGEEGKDGIEVKLKAGDMLMYRGCDLEHWREPFEGKDCGQVFLHYNDSSNPKAKFNKFDGRPMIGLPDYYAQKMIDIFDCPYIAKVNNKKFQQDLIKYTKETKCCDKDNCNHPKIQSDLKIDKSFKIIDDSINNLFKSYLGTDKFKFTKKNVWGYYASKGSQLQNVVHNHAFKKEKGLQLSALMYITPTKLGTSFANFRIEPEINKWYLWHSGLYHHPEDGVTPKDRIVLALSTVINRCT